MSKIIVIDTLVAFRNLAKGSYSIRCIDGWLDDAVFT